MTHATTCGQSRICFCRRPHHCAAIRVDSRRQVVFRAERQDGEGDVLRLPRPSDHHDGHANPGQTGPKDHDQG